MLVREEIAEAGVDLLRSRFDVDADGDERPRVDHRPLRRDRDPLGDEADRRPDRGGDNLKVIGRAGVGVDNVDVDAATRRGIVVANAPESNVISAAEHTVGLLVALARNIPQAHARSSRAAGSARSGAGSSSPRRRSACSASAGSASRSPAAPLGLQMRVVAYDPFVSAERFRELGVESDTFEGVLAQADFITLHLPLNDETRGAINADAIAKMKDGVRIVNAARGELVDEAALIAALESGKVAGAAIDVFTKEPYSGPLLRAPNVVVTPHLAASTDEAQDRAGLIVAEQVVAALEGGLVTNAVNIPSVGADDLEVLGPFVPLAARLGRLALELARGEPSRITLEYYGELAGYDTRLLTVAALNGAFRGRVDQPVNYVNAPLIAAERGIEVVEEKRRTSRDFTNLIAVAAGDVRVAGHDDRPDHRQWLVSALGFDARDRARAADDLPALRRRPRRDRPRRHAARRGRREHREHGRLAQPRGREGADGALDRHARDARGARAARRGRRRRLPRRHRP